MKTKSRSIIISALGVKPKNGGRLEHLLCLVAALLALVLSIRRSRPHVEGLFQSRSSLVPIGMVSGRMWDTRAISLFRDPLLHMHVICSTCVTLYANPVVFARVEFDRFDCMAENTFYPGDT